MEWILSVALDLNYWPFHVPRQNRNQKLWFVWVNSGSKIQIMTDNPILVVLKSGPGLVHHTHSPEQTKTLA